MRRRLYLIWRIWATTRNLQRVDSSEGQELLEDYYRDLYELEFPWTEDDNAKDA